MDEQLTRGAHDNQPSANTGEQGSSRGASSGMSDSGGSGNSGGGASGGGTINQAVSAAGDMTDQARSMAADAGSRAHDFARRAGGSLYDQGARAGGYLTRGVDEYPFTALLVAGAIGYGLAYLIHNQWSVGNWSWGGSWSSDDGEDQGRNERQRR